MTDVQLWNPLKGVGANDSLVSEPPDCFITVLS